MHKNILVPIDDSAPAWSALKQAARMAKALDTRLTIICIVEENPFTNTDFYYFGADAKVMQTYFEEACRNASTALALAEKLAREYGVTDVQTELVKGEVSAQAILQTAQQSNADLIVMGSHGYRSMHKLALGSIAEAVLQQAELPVLIVKKSRQ